jgi:hypothetical protein
MKKASAGERLNPFIRAETARTFQIDFEKVFRERCIEADTRN